MSLGASPATTNVTLTIGGRTYAVACAHGEEDHVRGLGRTIAAKLDAMPSNIALGEARALLFAALLLADELHELKQDITAPAPPTPMAEELSVDLDAIGRRLENIASALEDGATSA